MSFGNKFVLFVLLFVGAHVTCMDLCFTEDIIKKVVIPYFTLQSIARFGQTCKVYKEIFEPGKIDEPSSCFSNIKNDYYRCTQALARCALYENAKMFESLWCYDAIIRNKNIELLEGKKVPFVHDVMSAYRKYYGDLQAVDTRIAAQLSKAILDNDINVIRIIVQSKRHNIFELFNDDSIESALRAMTERQVYTICFDNILAVLPIENGENKNRAVQYISKYDDLNVLCNLLKKDYLKIDQEYGHKCTLLHYAALRGCRKLTDELLKKGADVHAVNAWGKQPIDYAEIFEQNHRDIGYLFMWRGFGVIQMLRDQCWKKHLPNLTEKCYTVAPPQQEFNTEEVAWLRNSCTYSINLAQ